MSSKKTALVVLLLGLAVMVFALIDPTHMAGAENTSPGAGAMGALGTWNPLRIGVLSAGALLGILGAYSLGKKPPKKK